MIRKINILDLTNVALLVRDMYREVFAEHCTEDLTIYLRYVEDCINSNSKEIYVTNTLDGFMLVEDVSEPMTPSLKRIDGNKIYVRPENRNGRVLKEFYDTLFREYPDGDILGVTEINSKHIPVLDKRHEHIANVYRLRRS